MAIGAPLYQYSIVFWGSLIGLFEFLISVLTPQRLSQFGLLYRSRGWKSKLKVATNYEDLSLCWLLPSYKYPQI